MNFKNNPYLFLFYGLLILVVLYLLKEQPFIKMESGTSTHIDGGSLDVIARGIDIPEFPREVNVKTDSAGIQTVSLGGDRFAVIDGNKNSESYGKILIYEYDEKTRKLNFLATDNVVTRMNQRTE